MVLRDHRCAQGDLIECDALDKKGYRGTFRYAQRSPTPVMPLYNRALEEEAPDDEHKYQGSDANERRILDEVYQHSEQSKVQRDLRRASLNAATHTCFSNSSQFIRTAAFLYLRESSRSLLDMSPMRSRLSPR